jgi:hypothetical protein
VAPADVAPTTENNCRGGADVEGELCSQLGLTFQQLQARIARRAAATRSAVALAVRLTLWPGCILCAGGERDGPEGVHPRGAGGPVCCENTQGEDRAWRAIAAAGELT